jgi:hypothetical protein
MLKKIKHATNVLESIVREKRKSKKRSNKWDDVRDSFVSMFPQCAACGSKIRLQVHHIIPYDNRPELELEISNLITLCMDTNECHLLIGHGGSFRHYNPNVVMSANEYLIAAADQRKLLLENIKRNRLD